MGLNATTVQPEALRSGSILRFRVSLSDSMDAETVLIVDSIYHMATLKRMHRGKGGSSLLRIRQWRIILQVVILETPIFTKRVTKLLSDDEYKELQIHLVSRPDVGALIPGSGGLRKIQWAVGRKGKRGGARFIYYWVMQHDKILMLMVYAKNEQANLTPEQLKILKKMVVEEFK